MGIIIYYSCTVVVIIYLLEFTKGSTRLRRALCKIFVKPEKNLS